MRNNETKQENTASRWVTFRLNGEKYGVNVMDVQEILRVTEITPVPGAASYVLGIINLRGNVVTVVDARQCFGLMSKSTNDASRIIMMEANGLVVGFLVDSVTEVVEVRANEVEPAPNLGQNGAAQYIQGVSVRADGLLILVDLKHVISEQ